MAAAMDALERVVEDTVRPAATRVDAAGEFPHASVTALAEAGLLGLPMSASVGGGGGDLSQAVTVIRALSAACGSTAMVVMMHYTAAAVIDHHGPEEVRRAIATGRHLTTLAFSEQGSRSHFWAPMGTATRLEDGVRLDAHKSWITAAGEADSYVWSSRPVTADGPMTLWLVASDTAGLSEPGRFDGLGLRGNRSAPLTATGVTVTDQAILGADGAGLDIALAEVLPWFLILNAAFCVGLMETVTTQTGHHLRTTRLEHLDQALAEIPTTRMDHARMRIATDQAAALLHDTLTALSTHRHDTTLKILEAKAAAGQAATTVTNLAMKICGGAAFRKELAIERHFRDAHAIQVMAPTTDTLLDLLGRTINGLPLL
jgi:isovaleryl-CoA dehydrogenase